MGVQGLKSCGSYTGGAAPRQVGWRSSLTGGSSCLARRSISSGGAGEAALLVHGGLSFSGALLMRGALHLRRSLVMGGFDVPALPPTAISRHSALRSFGQLLYPGTAVFRATLWGRRYGLSGSSVESAPLLTAAFVKLRPSGRRYKNVVPNEGQFPVRQCRIKTCSGHKILGTLVLRLNLRTCVVMLAVSRCGGATPYSKEPCRSQALGQSRACMEHARCPDRIGTPAVKQVVMRDTPPRESGIIGVHAGEDVKPLVSCTRRLVSWCGVARRGRRGPTGA